MRPIYAQGSDRPQVSYYQTSMRAVSPSSWVAWIPLCLLSLLIFVSLHSWPKLTTAFLKHIDRATGSQSNAPQEIPALIPNAVDELKPDTSEDPFPALMPEVQRWSDDIQRWSKEYALDPELIAVVMQIESCGHPTVQSSVGAMGLFQVMPFHFSPFDDPFDPNTNAKRGLTYLAHSLELSDGHIDLALAGYNGGLSVILWDSSTWSAETRRFVSWGTGIYADIKGDGTDSPTLQAWLKAGGRTLCAHAARASISYQSE
jgi:soluble lytic murein transglycosylase-like protein